MPEAIGLKISTSVIGHPLDGYMYIYDQLFTRSLRTSVNILQVLRVFIGTKPNLDYEGSSKMLQAESAHDFSHKFQLIQCALVRFA